MTPDTRVVVRRGAMIGRVALAAALASASGCSDGVSRLTTSPPDSLSSSPRDSLPGLVVSAPVLGAAGAAGSGRVSVIGLPAAAASGMVTYVSMVPGSVPTGLRATIRDLATGASATAFVENGGFDPVGLAANVGDTLTVDITRSGTAGTLHGVEEVRANRPPVVVRTDPPPQKVDVPLNSIMVIVFSEPIDSATLNTGSVRLLHDGTLVAGTIRFSDAASLRAEFHPDTLLARKASYRLVVTQAIHDVNGLALESALDVPFTTGTTAPASGLVFASVSAGTFHTCGVTTDGKAYCWGYNAESQLGNGTTVSSTTPVPVAGGLTFASVSAGYISTCGVTTSGAAYCWGSSALGVGEEDWASRCTSQGCSTPLPVAGGHTFRMVSVGDFHACGVTTDGAAYCWGQGLSGELGAGFTGSGPGSTFSGTPVAVAGGHAFAAVSAGSRVSCGVTTDGAAYCWGGNAFGELGTGTSAHLQCGSGADTGCSFIPVAVTGGLTFTQVSVGEGFTCGVATTGAAYCWGDNTEGQLGTGSTTGPEVCVYSEYGDSSPCSRSPVAVNGGLSFSMMSVKYETCGLTTAGAAYCWNAPGNPGTASLVPRPVAEGLTFASASASLRQMCGVTPGGVAYCWGGNPNGELGNGTATNSSVPVKVAGQP